MAKCLECVHWRPCFNGKEWDAAIALPCEYFAPDIIVGGKTNADLIRAMTDEELADILTAAAGGGFLTETGRRLCYEKYLDWLKQPVKDGGNDG